MVENFSAVFWSPTKIEKNIETFTLRQTPILETYKLLRAAYNPQLHPVFGKIIEPYLGKTMWSNPFFLLVSKEPFFFCLAL